MVLEGDKIRLRQFLHLAPMIHISSIILLLIIFAVSVQVYLLMIEMSLPKSGKIDFDSMLLLSSIRKPRNDMPS